MSPQEFQEFAGPDIFKTDANGKRVLNPNHLGVMLAMGTMGDVQAVPGISASLGVDQLLSKAKESRLQYGENYGWNDFINKLTPQEKRFDPEKLRSIYASTRNASALSTQGDPVAFMNSPEFKNMTNEAKDAYLENLNKTVAQHGAHTLGVDPIQNELELASKEGNYAKVKNILDTIPADSPIKSSMESIFRKGAENKGTIAGLTQVDPVSGKAMVRGNSVPAHQSEFAAAISSRDLTRAKEIIANTAPTDPYYENMVGLLKRIIGEGKMPHTTVGGASTTF